jgi:hypothetical protein
MAPLVSQILLLLSMASIWLPASVARPYLVSPRIQCAIKALNNPFSLGRFDLYPQFFHNESVMVLAQAGMYKGPSDIEEYVKFVYPYYSPYTVSNGDEYEQFSTAEAAQFVEYDEDGNCVFLVQGRARYTMDPVNTSSSDTFDVLYMIKAFQKFTFIILLDF